MYILTLFQLFNCSYLNLRVLPLLILLPIVTGGSKEVALVASWG